VLFLDLDRFKAVNDTFGHAIGDQLLQSVAHRLKSAIRDSDTVSRQGGDEFVLLLSEVSQEKILAQKIEKIHQIITAPYCVSGNDLDIGATIGVSVFPADGEDAETLIRNADAAMYYAKENGRNNFEFFRQKMRAIEMERRTIEASLYQAIEKQQLVLFYQAQVNLESSAITGVEALIRWQHPDRGLLLPASFIPFAEENGAIVPIGRWVLREACRQAQSWLEAGLAFNVIAVNISALEFENDQFLENVHFVLQETGLAPNRLELELTETVLMKSMEDTAKTLHGLRSMGVRISIDDFGTGYSSLSYLKRFPVDTMKIDQTFVRDIVPGADDILLNAIIGIGKSLRHDVIVEGVETAAQIAFLRENQCASVQGFYVNMPMRAEEFTAILKQGVSPNILH
jgi:diguanylate cyclase